MWSTCLYVASSPCLSLSRFVFLVSSPSLPLRSLPLVRAPSLSLYLYLSLSLSLSLPLCLSLSLSPSFSVSLSLAHYLYIFAPCPASLPHLLSMLRVAISVSALSRRQGIFGCRVRILSGHVPSSGSRDRGAVQAVFCVKKLGLLGSTTFRSRKRQKPLCRRLAEKLRVPFLPAAASAHRTLAAKSFIVPSPSPWLGHWIESIGHSVFDLRQKLQFCRSHMDVEA